MPTETLQERGAADESAVQVERWDRPARPFPEPFAPRDQDHRPVVTLDQPRCHDADHALVPVFAPDDVGAAAPSGLRPVFDLCDRRPQDLVLDGLPIAIQILQAIGKTSRLVGVVGQQQLERGTRMAEPARGVDPRRQPEADLARVDGGGIDARNLHQCAQSRLLCAGKRPQPRDRQRAVLADERHDVGDRRQRNEIEVAPENV